jgi:hypothetical protein
LVFARKAIGRSRIADHAPSVCELNSLNHETLRLDRHPRARCCYLMFIEPFDGERVLASLWPMNHFSNFHGCVS